MADAQPTAPPKPSPRRKSGKHPERALSAAFVRTVKKPGRYCDGHGLYLNVIPSGARSWVQRIAIQGRRRELGLGGWPLVSLSEACEVAFANRKLARAGGDPLADKRRAEGMPSFIQVAAKVYQMHRPGWRNAKYAAQWEAGLRAYAYGRIGEMPVSEVTTADVLQVLEPIWHDKPETARRVRARIGAVMKWAMAQGYRGDNPAGEAITQALPRHRKRRQHMRALPHAEVAGAIKAIRVSDASGVVKLALELLVLTAARSGEVRLATWQEVDWEAGVWTLAAERMKSNRAHRVPLSGRAIEILHEARRLSDGEGLVFPGARAGRPLADATLSRVLRQLDIAAVPHGFPLIVSGLGGGVHQRTAGGGRGGAGACGARPDRGGLCALRPAGAETAAHG